MRTLHPRQHLPKQLLRNHHILLVVPLKLLPRLTLTRKNTSPQRLTAGLQLSIQTQTIRDEPEFIRQELSPRPEHLQQINVNPRRRRTITEQHPLTLQVRNVELHPVIRHNRVSVVEQIPRVIKELLPAVMKLRPEQNPLLVIPLSRETQHPRRLHNLTRRDVLIPQTPHIRDSRGRFNINRQNLRLTRLQFIRESHRNTHPCDESRSSA